MQRIEEQLCKAADWLDDCDQVRANAMLLGAQRSILACCFPIAPASPQELFDVIEQRADHRATG